MAKPKAKTKAKAKPKAKAKAKPKAKAAPAKKKKKPAQEAKPAAKPAKAKPAAAAVVVEEKGASQEANVPGDRERAMAPFAITETSPGNYSLLLTQFEPASEVFDAAGIDGGGYAWEGVARHVGDVIAPELSGRFGLDPEASMFCAYGSDRAALGKLGVELARLFHDASALAKVIETVGRDGFDD